MPVGGMLFRVSGLFLVMTYLLVKVACCSAYISIPVKKGSLTQKILCVSVCVSVCVTYHTHKIQSSADPHVGWHWPAGYPGEMEEMLRAANPGLARRIQLQDAWHFEDYDDEDLMFILRNKALDTYGW